MIRIQYPGAYYHLMNRGNRSEDIFITETDYRRFVEALANSCETFVLNLDSGWSGEGCPASSLRQFAPRSTPV
jgi:hypothetical protein